jgi:16S rRNA (uracil1498-N3)-methyltransferase
VKSAPWLLAAPTDLAVGTTAALDPVEAKHASGALRLRAGGEVVLADGAGKVAVATLISVGRKVVEVEILSVEECLPLRGSGVTLAVAVVGNRAMDWAVQKAVEVGVRAFVPLLSERSQPGKREIANRVEHWRRVARQSLKQCRRPWAMEVLDVYPMADFIKTENVMSPGVIADPDGCSATDLPRGAGRLLLIGPEGGFSPAELELLDGFGCLRLRLGPHILRTETAAAVGGATLVALDEERLGLNSADE